MRLIRFLAPDNTVHHAAEQPDGSALRIEGDIYGAHLNVRFVRKLRDEMKFPGLDALRAQIAQDAASARSFFGLS